MAFDWLRFLRTHNIEYIERGPNVAKGNVAIHCPWCGEADRSHHLGVSIKGHGWGCWRNATHRGRSPVRLVQALLRCTLLQAERIVGVDATELPEQGDFLQTLGNMLNGQPQHAEEEEIKPLKFPSNFRPLHERGMGPFFCAYLADERHYGAEAKRVAKRYDLRGCLTGAFAYRIILPIYMPDAGLVTWTGRAISATATIRYKTLSRDAEKAQAEGMPQALLSIKQTLWNCAELYEHGGETLVVCEGPLDAMWVDWIGMRYGIRATCLFGKQLSEAQALWLEELAPRFDRKILLLDRDAVLDAMPIQAILSRSGFEFRSPPAGAKDPAEMLQEEVLQLRYDVPPRHRARRD